MNRTAPLILLLCLAVPAHGQPADGSGAPARAPAEGSGAPPSDPSAAVPAPPDAPPVPDLAVTLSFPGGPAAAVGAPVRVTVSAAIPAEYSVAAINVIGNRFVEELADDGAEVVAGQLSRELSLVVYRSGTFRATIEVVLIDGDGRQLRALSEPFELAVASSIVNETDPSPAPSDPPMPVLTRDMRPLWVGAGLACGLLGFLASLAWRSRAQRAAASVDEGPRRPAWEIALEQLDALEAEGLLDQGKHLEFHMRLSEILRTYIGARFGFFAPEMTTTEIAAWMAARPDQVGEYREDVVSTLSEMDLVKFARFEPPRDMSDECMERARRLVVELSARERQRVAEGEAQDEGSPAESRPAAEDASANKAHHAPSPESTTDAFGVRPETPDNVVRLPRREDPS